MTATLTRPRAWKPPAKQHDMWREHVYSWSSPDPLKASQPPRIKRYDHQLGDVIEYAGRAHYGAKRTGVIWSDGPAKGSFWVLPDGEPVSFASMVVVSAVSSMEFPKDRATERDEEWVAGLLAMQS